MVAELVAPKQVRRHPHRRACFPLIVRLLSQSGDVSGLEILVRARRDPNAISSQNRGRRS